MGTKEKAMANYVGCLQEKTNKKQLRIKTKNKTKKALKRRHSHMRHSRRINNYVKEAKRCIREGGGRRRVWVVVEVKRSRRRGVCGGEEEQVVEKKRSWW